MIDRYSDNMTYEYILDRMLEKVPDNVDKREGSIIYDALAPAAAELTKVYMELDIIMDETFVDTASLQYLILRCKERGIKIKSETAAIIEGTFTPNNLELKDGTLFSCDDINYSVKEKLSNGVYRLEAQTLGPIGNKYTGFLLPVEVINGLQTAQITNLLVAGEDADTAETLRAKYYNSVNNNSFGGNIADYKNKVNEISGVGGVKVYPVWKGGGTVKIVVISSDYSVPSSELISKVQTDIDPETNHGEGLGLAPIGHNVTVEGVKEFEIDVKSNITFLDNWDFEKAKSLIENSIRSYFNELSKSWEDNNMIVIRISQIEARILDIECIVDIADTTLNGQSKNLEILSDYIPKLKSVGEIL